ncbi:MAG TPA: outer membrane protein assembly factor BamD [Terriglobales bacterium]|nr:outer membrane protein assembly factor BamD [Terriglobales bacterium]
MSRRIPVLLLLGALLFAAACTNKKVNNPLSNVDSKQPDKVLFDRAMDAMKHNRFDVARLTLQTLINTYPDSEFLARAKLGIADSWYAEGGTAGLQQAEVEYNDFKTFFPNMPEAAEAQLKIANIHYQQMEKPDRDFTHAMRAEEEYRNLILQFPDSKLVPVAKQRLLEVQEVLAEREYEVGRFYYMRETYPAAIARLQTVIDRYPLYSKADEVLYLLGRSYEGEIDAMRARPTCVKPYMPGCVPEAAKARMIQDFTREATAAYSRILTRYPVMDRVEDAKQRLIALHQPVPKPTAAEISRNKAEQASRHDTGTMAKVLRNFNKHPDVAQAAHTGDPTLVDPQPVSATSVVQEATRAALGMNTGGNNSVSVETVGTGAPPPNQPAPRSDATAPADGSATTDSTGATTPASNELTPNVNSDSNELKPNVPSDDGAAPPPPPQQVNEIPGGSGQNSSASAQSQGSSSSNTADDSGTSSSKHKKKKGLKKVIPF